MKRIALLVVAVLAIAAVAIPAAGARSQQPGDTTHLDIDLEIFDLATSTTCNADVFANVSVSITSRVQRDRTGAVVSLDETYHGRIQWFTRGTGKSYSSNIEALVHSEFPEGVDFFKPAKITVIGKNGGVFPIGGSPAGAGVLVYDGFIYSVGDGDYPYVTTDGDPILKLGDFSSTTKRICAALA